MAIVNDEFYVVTPEYVFQFDATTWGWIKLIWGIIVFLAGLGLFSGAVLARTVGVIVAVVSAIVNFAWFPWYPVWGDHHHRGRHRGDRGAHGARA